MMLHDNLYLRITEICVCGLMADACILFVVGFAGAVSRKLAASKFYDRLLKIMLVCSGVLILAAVTAFLELIAEGAGIANLVLLITLAACVITELTYDDREEVAKARGPARPPEFALRHWFRSPDNVVTQKFEGGYDGSLNREFERKKLPALSAEERQEQEQKPNAPPSEHEEWMDLWS